MKIIEEKQNAYVIITPSEAEKLYSERHKNRPVSMAKVKQYAKAMTDNKWKPCTTLYFYKGKLEDGQHRMLACVISGKDFEGYANFHNDSEQFSVYDTGRSRSNSDVLAIAGKKHYKVASSALRVLEQINSKQGLTHCLGGGLVSIPTYDIEEIYEKYPDLEYSCSVVPKRKASIKLPSGSAVVLHYLLRKAEIGVSNTAGLESFMTDKFFVEHLIKGYGLHEDHPVSAFRHYINRCYAQEIKGTDRVSHHAMIHGGIYTWNKWIRGKTMKRLVINPQSNKLPKILLPARG